MSTELETTAPVPLRNRTVGLSAVDLALWLVALCLAVVLLCFTVLSDGFTVRAGKGAVGALGSDGPPAADEQLGLMRLFELGDGSGLILRHEPGGTVASIQRGRSEGGEGWQRSIQLPGVLLRSALITGIDADQLFVMTEDAQGERSLSRYVVTAAAPVEFHRFPVGAAQDLPDLREFPHLRAFQVLPGGRELVLLRMADAPDGRGQLFRLPLGPCVDPAAPHCAAAAPCAKRGGESVVRTTPADSKSEGFSCDWGKECGAAEGPRKLGEPLDYPGMDELAFEGQAQDRQLVLRDAEGRELTVITYADGLAVGGADL